MDLQTLFLGEPEYDENRNVINRKLGVQNMIAWLAVGLVGYRLMCRGGKKQKGGATRDNEGVDGGAVFGVILALALVCALAYKLIEGLVGLIADDSPAFGG